MLTRQQHDRNWWAHYEEQNLNRAQIETALHILKTSSTILLHVRIEHCKTFECIKQRRAA
jgi:hypothetical protein